MRRRSLTRPGCPVLHLSARLLVRCFTLGACALGNVLPLLLAGLTGGRVYTAEGALSSSLAAGAGEGDELGDELSRRPDASLRGGSAMKGRKKGRPRSLEEVSAGGSRTRSHPFPKRALPSASTEPPSIWQVSAGGSRREPPLSLSRSDMTVYDSGRHSLATYLPEGDASLRPLSRQQSRLNLVAARHVTRTSPSPPPPSSHLLFSFYPLVSSP